MPFRIVLIPPCDQVSRLYQNPALCAANVLQIESAFYLLLVPIFVKTDYRHDAQYTQRVLALPVKLEQQTVSW